MLEFSGVSKAYPGVNAVQDVDLTVPGEQVTAIVGENGAGKSTLIKVLAGAVRPDSGKVLLNGVQLPSRPGDVISAGVSVIYQELTDVPNMTVTENVLLGQMPQRGGVIERRRARRRAKEALERVGIGHLDLDRTVATLSIAEKQLVEIARCLSRNTAVLVMDEPTSALAEREADALLDAVRKLRSQGLAIIFVSHNLDDVFAIADSIAVMRDGALVAKNSVSEFTRDSLVQTMLAKSIEHAYPWRPRPVGEPLLQVGELSGPGVHDVSLHVDRGELVGLVGLAGAGRTEAMKAIAGITRANRGTVQMEGQMLTPGSISAARASGLFYSPEDRKREAAIEMASVEANIIYGAYDTVATHGVLRRAKVGAAFTSAVNRFEIKITSPRQPLGQLSGGNQQRVLLGRLALNSPRVVLLDDPTRGIDVGAKSSIYEHVMGMANEGVGFLLTSSEIEEVMAMADRVYVMRAGSIVGEFDREAFDREAMLRLATIDVENTAGSSQGSMPAVAP